MTPLPKRGFGPPSYGTFSTPLTCRCSVFPVQKSTTEQTRSSFGGVQNFSGGRVLWYVFLPPYVLHPPISRPKKSVELQTKCETKSGTKSSQNAPKRPRKSLNPVKKAQAKNATSTFEFRLQQEIQQNTPEMYCLRHREPYPDMLIFLSSFVIISLAKLALKSPNRHLS